MRRSRVWWLVVLLVAAVAAAVLGVQLHDRHHDHQDQQDQQNRPAVVTGADLTWHPGLNHAGPDLHTHLGQRDAQDLAAAIAGAPASPPGTRSCPADFASSVSIRFDTSSRSGTSPGARPAQVVALSGCRGPAGHLMTDRLQQLLDHDQPAGFRTT